MARKSTPKSPPSDPGEPIGIEPGDIVSTSYGSGPYRVVSVDKGSELYCPICARGHRLRPEDLPVYSLVVDHVETSKRRKGRDGHLRLDQLRRTSGRVIVVRSRCLDEPKPPFVAKPPDEVFVTKPGSPAIDAPPTAPEPVEPRICEPTPAPAKKGPPGRRPNAEVRGREHLTPAEVERLADAAFEVGRHRDRDWLMIMMAFRHGFRVAELVKLRRDQVDLETGVLHCKRVKRGVPSTHPLGGQEIRSLRKLFRDYPDSPFVFVSERLGPMSDGGVRKMVARAGVAAELPFPVHPHMLRHSTGFKLANDGQDTRAIQHYLGHRNIQHTVRYTELAGDRFKDFFKD